MLKSLLLLSLIISTVSFAASEVREKLLYVEYRIEPSPEWAKNNPNKMWVARDRYMRNDEPPDSAGGIHGSLIVNEPDAWMLNWLSMQGMHIVDQGPTLVVRPMVLGSDPSTELGQLEFGREVKFFTDRGATPIGKQSLEGISCTGSQIQMDSLVLQLFVDESNGKPKRLLLIQAADTVMVLYDKYETDLPIDTLLFRPPAGFKIHEQK